MPESLIFFLVIPVLLQPVMVLMSFLRLMQLRYRYPAYQLQHSKTISPDLKQVLQPAIDELRGLGFKACSAYRVEKLLYIECADDRGIFLYHPQTQCFAEVELRYPVDSLDLSNVVFYNVLHHPGWDTTWLITMNGLAHNILGAIPNAQIEDIYHPTLTGQWEHHQSKLECLLIQRSHLNLTPEQFVVALQSLQHQYIDSLLVKQSLLPSLQGYILSWRAALNLAIKIRVNVGLTSRRQTTLRQAQKSQSTPPVQIPISIQMDSFSRMRELETNRRSLRLSKWILLISLGGFVLMAIAMPRSFGVLRLTDLCSLVVVLFLHEAGHFLAMKAFGYQDTTMFFLPMFGAAVTGKKENASLSEKIWVLLAGPLPGMVLGFGLIAVIHFYPNLAWLNHMAMLLIGLNLLNLLPFYPLDGGKIAHHLLFSRYPFTDVVFKSITVLLFGLLGLTSPMLLVLAAATAISIPTSYRTAKLNQTIQQHLQKNPQDNLLELIFRQMSAAGWSNLPFLRRDAMVKDLLERQHENYAPLWSRLGLAGIYGLSLLVGIVGTIVALVLPRPNSLMAQNNRLTIGRSHQVNQPINQHNQQANQQISQKLGQQVNQKLQAELNQVNSALRKKPNVAASYLQRAEIYRTLAFTETEISSSSATETPQAQLAYNASPSPTSPPPSQTRFLQALADYDQAIKLSPKSAESYRQRATLQTQLKRPKAAIADFSKVIQLDPIDLEAYQSRADLYLSLGNPKSALADANQLIKLNPKNPTGYALRAVIRQKSGDLIGARQDQQQAQQL